jgi:hypothetical protein
MRKPKPIQNPLRACSFAFMKRPTSTANNPNRNPQTTPTGSDPSHSTTAPCAATTSAGDAAASVWPR